MKRARRFLQNAALAAASVLLSVAAVEWGLRVFSPQVVNLNVNDELYDLDPELGAISKKNIDGVRLRVLHTFDAPVHTNSERLRGRREYALEKRPGSVRVLVLGDSFAFGWGVEDDATIPARLEALFRAEGRDVEVLNAAVYGFDTERYLRWNRRFLKYSPDLTLVGFCLENDFYISKLEPEPAAPAQPAAKPAAGDGDRGNPFAVSGWYSEFKKNVLLKSHVLALVRDQLYIRFPDIRRWLFRFGVNNKRLIFQKEYPAFLQEQVRLAGANLAALDRETRGAGGRLLVFSVPMREQVYAGEEIDRFEGFDSGRPGEVLSAICRELGVECLDTLPELKRMSRPAKRRFYFETDPHLSEAGNDAFARLLHAELKARYPEIFG